MNTTVINIVNILQQFHSELADYYSVKQNDSYDPRVINLLDYLGRSERYLADYIDIHRHDISLELRKTVVGIPLNLVKWPFVNFSDNKTFDKMDTYEGVLTYALRMDSLLIRYCKAVKENVKEPVLHQTFNNLCRVTSKERQNLFTYNGIFAG